MITHETRRHVMDSSSVPSSVLVARSITMSRWRRPLLAAVPALLALAGCAQLDDPDRSPASDLGEASAAIAANAGSRYKVGDWNGDGRDNLAVRRGNQVVMDVNFDGAGDFTQAYGNGNSENQYL